MGFILLIFHSFFSFDPVKLTGFYAVIEAVLFFSGQVQIAIVLVKVLAFFIFAVLINKYSDSILKWLVLLISAGLLF